MNICIHNIYIMFFRYHTKMVIFLKIMYKCSHITRYHLHLIKPRYIQTQCYDKYRNIGYYINY